MGIKILENLFLTIERGNPLKRQDQTIHKRIMVYLGLLKCGEMEMESTIDQGNLIKILGTHWEKLTLIVENIFSAGRRILQGTKRLFTIERGNLCRSSPPGYSKMDYGRSWSSQEWKSGATEHDRSGKPEKTSWNAMRQVRPHREEPLLRRKCAFRKVRRDNL